ncbi:MAG: hypothetical protein RIR26_103 [Pseudomonadota bacterium]|jgi:hypothetical protein
MGVGELRAGEDYSSLPNLNGIYIFDDVFRGDVDDFHLVYEPTCVKPSDGTYLQQGLLRMDFIQLPKFSALNPSENQLLSAWIQLFGAKSAEEIESAASKAPVLSKFLRSLKDMSANPKLVDLVEKHRLERIIDKRARAGELEDAKAEARQTGRAEGRAEGLEEGREEGQIQATSAAVQKVLIKRLNLSPQLLASRLSTLSASQLEALLDAALDFQSADDFENWLKQNA